LFHAKIQRLMKIACQRCERGVVRKPLKQFADIGDPERALETGANLVQAFRKGQKRLLGPVAGSDRQSPPDFFRGDSNDMNDLVPAGLAGRYGNGGTWNLQKICEEFNAGFIGPSFHGRSGQGHFQRIPELAGDGVLPGTRVDFDCKRAAGRRVVNGDHQNRLPTQSARRKTKQQTPQPGLCILSVLCG